MADVIPITLPCTQFPDTECEVWLSLATAAEHSFPNCEDIFFPDLFPLADDRLEKVLDDIIHGNKDTMEVATNTFSLSYDDKSDTSIDENEENNEFTGFSPLQNPTSNPFVSEEDEDREEQAEEDGGEEEDEEYEEDFSSPDETFNALVAYAKAFPDGHEIIPTPATGFLCGFNAVIRSMKAMHSYLPCPTVEGLQEVFRSPAFAEHASAFGMTNEDNFSVDQVGAVLFFWGLYHRLNLRIGYLAEGEAPLLLPHPIEEPAHIVWIHNDNEGNEETGELGHFSGMRSVCY